MSNNDEVKDGIIKVNVRFVYEDIWFNHIADLFKTMRQHIKNIY